jgi:hypothetical protein
MSRESRNAAARIQVLRDEMERIQRKCDGYRLSSDQNACYYYEGYHKLRQELKKLEAENGN